jgi:hypothetical protein
LVLFVPIFRGSAWRKAIRKAGIVRKGCSKRRQMCKQMKSIFKRLCLRNEKLEPNAIVCAVYFMADATSPCFMTSQ